MKKLITLLLLVSAVSLNGQTWMPLGSNSPKPAGITVSSNAEGNITTRVQVEGFFLTEVNAASEKMFQISTPDDARPSVAGIPDAGYLTISLLIPPAGNYSISVLNSKYIEYNNILIAPSQGDPAFSDPYKATDFQYSEELLESGNFSPAQIAEAGQPYIWGDNRGIAIQVSPFFYNPSTGVLRVYTEISLELKPISGKGINEITRYSGSYGIASGMALLSESHFANFTRNERYSPVEESGNMLIVAPADYFEALKPFTDWKIRCGITCEVVDAAMFQTAEQLKSYVSDKYYNLGLTYLLLAGDAQQVPVIQNENGYGDNIYGYLAGDDHYPEIIVGRFPAASVSQLSIMVKRTIDYELYGNGGANYSSFLGIGSELGPGDDGELDYEHIRKIGNQLKEYNYSKFTELYDGTQGGNDAPGNPSASMIESAINAGHGAVMYIGHGTPVSWSTGAFSNDNVSRLSNTGTHPFIWAAGCSSGDFASATSLAEYWLRAEHKGNPAGAVAAMMSTGKQSWYPPMEAQDEMALILSGKKSTVTTRTFGGISMSGCMKMNDKYQIGGYKTTDTWNIFGDPSVMLRTAAPEVISAHHASITGADAREFVVKLPVPEAMACITYNGKLYGAGRAQEGTAVITLSDLPQEGTLQLTITAYNHLPYSAEIEITKLPATACNPLPVNFAGKVSPYTSLSWEATGGAVPAFYEIIISENADLSNPVQSLMSFTTNVLPEFALKYSTTYFWKVVSHNSNGDTHSRVFRFTTSRQPDEDFESQGFPRSNWINNDEPSWFIDGNNSFEGKYSLRSGQTADNGSSRLAYSCYSETCDMLGFRIKVSSQENADKLTLIIDGEVAAVYSGNIDWREESFAVEAGEHLIEWIYTKDGAVAEGSDAAWIDNIYLPGNEMAEVNLQDFTTCRNPLIDLYIGLENVEKVVWSSAGSGILDDVNSHRPVYTASQEDYSNGGILFYADVFYNNNCGAVRHELRVTFWEEPQLPSVNDTTLYQGEELEILLPVSATVGYKLLPAGTEGTRFVVKADELPEGENILTISCENEGGCSAEKSFTVNVVKAPRPQAGKEILAYPNPAKEKVSFVTTIKNKENAVVSIFNISGQEIMQSPLNQFSDNSVDVSALPHGVYMVRIENGEEVQNGRFIKTL
ncbi:MAG: C25 family cysteine peptidase [Lentimicrobium sp.]|nr:C25 family cysteine peptidase [Lentimicrobium sp.]